MSETGGLERLNYTSQYVYQYGDARGVLNRNIRRMHFDFLSSTHAHTHTYT